MLRGREPLVAAGLTLLLHGAVLAFGAPGVLEGRLVDPDCYVRLMRIERLLATGDWWDGLMPLLDAPTGLVMHWTRLFDVVVLLVSAPLMPFLPPEDALFWGGALASPLLQAAAAALVAWGARAVTDGRTALLAVVLFLAQPAVYGVYQVGRADHHSLHLTLAVAVLALLLVWSVRRTALALPLLAGLAAAAGLWVGAEALMTIAVAGGALGLAWLLREEQAASALGRFAAGLAGGTTVALAVERPPAEWIAVELDRLSLVHLVLVLLLAAAAGLVRLVDRRADLAPTGRLALAAVAGLVVVVPMAGLFPAFLAGPYGEVDPEVAAVFLAHVREAEPMLARGRSTLADAVFALGPLVPALAFAAVALRRGGGRRLPWLLLAVAMAVYLAATLHQMRVLSYVQAAQALPWAAAALAVGHAAMTGLRRPWRAPVAALGTAVVLLGPAVAGALLLDTSARAAVAALEDRCDWPALTDWLAERPQRDGGTIATYVFPGPQIAWATGYGVISAPYHRNTGGILDVDRLFRAPDEEARQIADRRHLGLVVLCPASPGRGGHEWYLGLAGPDGLYGRLAAGRLPVWLSRTGTDDRRLDGFQVFEVTRP